MIELSSISKTYAKSGTRAVDSLSLTIPDGCIFGFLGPNGAGKTTTIRIITGALEADEGTVRIDGIELAKHPLEAKRHFGLVPDTPDMFSKLKAYEYLNFMADVSGVPADTRRTRIEDLASRLELSEVLKSPIGSMSRGMRQKLNIIASLVHQPHNWVLDEPIVGLDPRASFTLKELMRAHAASGGCVFFSTHVMEVAERICDRLAIINKGRIIFVGALEELRTLKEAGSASPSGEGAAAGESLEELFLALVDDHSGDVS
ncbi:MAG: ABC transporter ATP-binding protein [Rectinema sp.]|nr:ABC transporter ATP-binding protein [Rectinema sp.]